MHACTWIVDYSPTSHPLNSQNKIFMRANRIFAPNTELVASSRMYIYILIYIREYVYICIYILYVNIYIYVLS